MKRVAYPVVAVLGFLSLLIIFLAGLGYQNGTFPLGQAFTVLRYGAYLGLASVVLVVVYLVWQRPQGLHLGIMLVAGLCGLIAFYLPYQQQRIAGTVPPIHDITTDTVNPPAFVAVLPRRADAPNPPDYAGEEIAAQQRQAYPDIQTVVYSRPSAEVFAAARELVEDMDWEVVEASRRDGRIEATATTTWFGFRDDVVIRVAEGEPGSTRFDIRSKSRVGRSDIGVNANRIRTFIAELNSRLGAG